MRMLGLLMGFFFLAACAVGPDYSRPTLSTPASFRMAGVEKETESFANLPWWNLLRDQELQRLIRTALEGNKDLKRAAASIEEYQARLYIARTDFAPQLSGTVNAPAFGRNAQVGRAPGHRPLLAGRDASLRSACHNLRFRQKDGRYGQP